MGKESEKKMPVAEEIIIQILEVLYGDTWQQQVSYGSKVFYSLKKILVDWSFEIGLEAGKIIKKNIKII